MQSRMDVRAVGVELKPSYYQQMLRNLWAAKWNEVSDQSEMFAGAADLTDPTIDEQEAEEDETFA